MAMFAFPRVLSPRASPGILQQPRGGEGLEGALTEDVKVEMGRLGPRVTPEVSDRPGL